jgi:hypothetical protein
MACKIVNSFAGLNVWRMQRLFQAILLRLLTRKEESTNGGEPPPKAEPLALSYSSSYIQRAEINRTIEVEVGPFEQKNTRASSRRPGCVEFFGRLPAAYAV